MWTHEDREKRTSKKKAFDADAVSLLVKELRSLLLSGFSRRANRLAVLTSRNHRRTPYAYVLPSVAFNLIDFSYASSIGALLGCNQNALQCLCMMPQEYVLRKCIYATDFEDKLLEVAPRINIGAPTVDAFRYPDDPYDRIWYSDLIRKQSYFGGRAPSIERISITKKERKYRDKENTYLLKLCKVQLLAQMGYSTKA
ncbi:hypothetical protein VNO77_05146 [Canavalia gladiata]|uniref:Malectin-like domain-containing protein n=1 Tax=Canavalia gladiata TaxID=3824 RepID=A0AAN9RDW7_CANGL